MSIIASDNNGDIETVTKLWVEYKTDDFDKDPCGLKYVVDEILQMDNEEKFKKIYEIIKKQEADNTPTRLLTIGITEMERRRIICPKRN